MVGIAPALAPQSVVHIDVVDIMEYQSYHLIRIFIFTKISMDIKVWEALLYIDHIPEIYTYYAIYKHYHFYRKNLFEGEDIFDFDLLQL